MTPDVRALTVELDELLPALRELVKRLNLLAEGFQHSFAGKLFGAQPSEKQRKQR